MKYILQFISLCLVFASCRKEQPPLTPLDCSCAKEVKADFLMEELTSTSTTWGRYTNTDTIYRDKNVRFTALEENADYTWYIGIEKIKTKEISRYFGNNMVGQTIPITLVVKKKPNNICFPNDDDYDSIIKYLTIVEYTDSLKIEGSYKVKSPLLPDSTIFIIDIVPDNLSEYFNIYNYDGVGSNCLLTISPSDVELNYRQLFIVHPPAISNGNYLQGDIFIKQDNTVIMNLTSGKYVDGVYNEKFYDWKYKGRKV